jgi:hypothetical protein
MRRIWLFLLLIPWTCGCTLMPQRVKQPVMHNPFPQLTKVGIAPFFNLSTESTVDGRQFALAYFNELQLIPGYEVIPVGVVEVAIRDHHIDLNGPADAQRLAQVLGVDVVVVGAVTDFSPYYPPRCAMQVEWYAANPNFHFIPPGYGLPWGTSGEKYLSRSVIFQAELTLAKEQLKTQTPPFQPMPASTAVIPRSAEPSGLRQPQPAVTGGDDSVRQANHTQPGGPAADTSGIAGTGGMAGKGPADGTNGIPGWPDARGFIPPPPTAAPPSPCPTTEPVMSHIRAFNGHDTDFTKALQDYYVFRDDARFGGWQSYLERSDDLIRFCCHMHIREMLAARGGADETRVVWRWPLVR